MAQCLLIVSVALYGVIMGHLTCRILQLMPASAFMAGASNIYLAPAASASPAGARGVSYGAYLCESSCALVFTAMLIFGGTKVDLPVGLLFGWFLLTLSWIDTLTLLLPDRLNGPLLACGLASHITAWDEADAFKNGLLGAICGGMALWGVQRLFRRVKGYEGLGGGDIKLLAALGAWLGWQALPGLCCGAALSGLAVCALSGRARGKIPFGPCLALAGCVMYISP